MFLEEFRALPVVGTGMIASTSIFTCFTLIFNNNSFNPKINDLYLSFLSNEEDLNIEESSVDTPEEESLEEPITEEIIFKVEEEIQPKPIEEISDEKEDSRDTEKIIEEDTEIKEEKVDEIVKVQENEPKTTEKPEIKEVEKEAVPEEKPKPVVKKKKTMPKSIKSDKDYSSKKRDNRDVFFVTPKKGNGYWLYRASRKLDFSLGFKDTDFSGIDIGNIKIKLFKNPVWTNMDLWDDEYGDYLSDEQIKSLFEDGDDNKVKQLLLSLSIKREWTKHIGDHYTTLGIHKPNKPYGSMDLKIKYFKEFESLKEYVQSKVSYCEETAQCTASESELDIMDQDRTFFFEDESTKTS